MFVKITGLPCDTSYFCSIFDQWLDYQNSNKSTTVEGYFSKSSQNNNLDDSFDSATDPINSGLKQ